MSFLLTSDFGICKFEEINVIGFGVAKRRAKIIQRHRKSNIKESKQKSLGCLQQMTLLLVFLFKILAQKLC